MKDYIFLVNFCFGALNIGLLGIFLITTVIKRWSAKNERKLERRQWSERVELEEAHDRRLRELAEQHHELVVSTTERQETLVQQIRDTLQRIE